MNLEKEVFRKSILNIDKLIPYGFKKENNSYFFSKFILDNTFRIDIEIFENGKVVSKVYDLSFNEEYTNHKIENQNGKFVSEIRNQLKNLLIDIRNFCFKEQYFINQQSNRISDLIINKYNDLPEFPWEKDSHSGVFKNPKNKKWYALIMNISKNKIVKEEEDFEVEILNIKLEPEKILNLLKKNGYYKAYHMNKENWITIILDDTLSDLEIMNLIEESHKFTEQKTEWVIPANPKYYDIITKFKESNTILWHQSTNMNIGDIIYIYMSAPYQSIMYKCEILEVNISSDYEDKKYETNKNQMKLKLLSDYGPDKYNISFLKDNGLTSVRGARRIPDKLSKAINKKV